MPRGGGRKQWTKADWQNVTWDGALPLDLTDLRLRFGACREQFADELGLLYLVGILKIPAGREVFMECSRDRVSTKDGYVGLFAACADACRTCASEPWKQRFDAECREIRGPLKQHGFIEEMKRLFVIAKTVEPDPSSLQLGVSGMHYNLLPYSAGAAVAFGRFHDLHSAVSAILIMGPPTSLETWRKYRDVLAGAVVRFHVTGLQGLAYCFEYSVRCFLDGFMYAENVAALQVEDGDLLDALPGPDQQNHRRNLKAVFRTDSVQELVQELRLTQSVHLLLGIACMVTSKTLSVVWDGGFARTKKGGRGGSSTSASAPLSALAPSGRRAAPAAPPAGARLTQTRLSVLWGGPSSSPRRARKRKSSEEAFPAPGPSAASGPESAALSTPPKVRRPRKARPSLAAPPDCDAPLPAR